ncbi:MAG: arylesterase [Rickettsiales bacterium]|nr:arylesterase [Rickettsiales bacterium]
MFITVILVMICGLHANHARAQQVTIKVVFFGDSLMAGFGLAAPQRDSLPAKMAAVMAKSKQGKYLQVENMGVSGDTSSSALGRLQMLIASKPDIVMVALGGNDVLRGIDPDITFNNLDIIIKELQRHGVYVLLAGMKAPPSMGSEYAARFNRTYGKLAEQSRAVFYPFLLDGVAGEPQFNLRDGIHPNPEGVDVIVMKLYPVMDEMVKNILQLKVNAGSRQSRANRQARKRPAQSSQPQP